MGVRGRDRGRTRRSATALLAIAALTASLMVSAALAADGAKKVRTLRLGEPAFWTGAVEARPASESGPLPVPLPPLPGEEESERPSCEGTTCVEYPLDVVERGAVLRVAVDSPDCQTEFGLELVSPSGEVRAEDSSCYSAEVYVDDPAKGVWIARVIPFGTEVADFRMRAKLEPKPRPSSGRRPLLPNLRVEPPHQFTFQGADGGLTGESTGCYNDEIVENGAQRCLRFSVGPQNAGAGPLELKFSRDVELSTDASMEQRIYYSDGSSEMRDAGTSEFHKTHQHFHLKGFAAFELFRVTDEAAGTLKRAGLGSKAGFCLVDLRIARWRKFNQQRAYTARSNCSPVGGRAELGLSAGWTDVYGYDLPGNYVDFKDNPDGRYVVRVQVNSLGSILESKKQDNVGYAYINVKGDSVTLLERGQGASPWDPNRIVFDGWASARS